MNTVESFKDSVIKNWEQKNFGMNTDVTGRDRFAWHVDLYKKISIQDRNLFETAIINVCQDEFEEIASNRFMLVSAIYEKSTRSWRRKYYKFLKSYLLSMNSNKWETYHFAINTVLDYGFADLCVLLEDYSRVLFRDYQLGKVSHNNWQNVMNIILVTLIILKFPNATFIHTGIFLNDYFSNSSDQGVIKSLEYFYMRWLLIGFLYRGSKWVKNTYLRITPFSNGNQQAAFLGGMNFLMENISGMTREVNKREYKKVSLLYNQLVGIS